MKRYFIIIYNMWHRLVAVYKSAPKKVGSTNEIRCARTRRPRQQWYNIGRMADRYAIGTTTTTEQQQQQSNVIIWYSCADSDECASAGRRRPWRTNLDFFPFCTLRRRRRQEKIETNRSKNKSGLTHCYRAGMAGIRAYYISRRRRRRVNY